MINLEIPAVPPSLNLLLRMSWPRRHAVQTKWRKWVWATLHEHGRHPGKPLERARITINRRSTGQLDQDNLHGSVKPVLDALTYNDVIVDDSPNHIDLVVTQSRGEPSTSIRVELAT